MVASTASPAWTISMTTRGRRRLAASSAERMGADDARSRPRAGEEVIDLRGRAVEDGDAVAVVGHVEDEVLTHDGQADQADVGVGAHSGTGDA